MQRTGLVAITERFKGSVLLISPEKERWGQTEGEAVMRFAVADGLEHALYYSYAERMWDFLPSL